LLRTAIDAGGNVSGEGEGEVMEVVGYGCCDVRFRNQGAINEQKEQNYASQM